jgi:hypothetical protein
MEYLLITDFQPGVSESPMEAWTEDEVQAHLDYYGVIHRELEASGELVQSEILQGPDLAKIVTADGLTAPVVTDGPFQEFKEWVAGFQIVDVESEARAIEIAAKLSAVPVEGGRPMRQPNTIRRVLETGPSTAAEMDAFLETATGGSR